MSTIDALFAAALEMHRHGALDDAIRGYREVLLGEPHHAEAHRLIGQVLSQRRDYLSAKGHILESLRLAPDNPLAHFALGNVLKQLELPDEALSHLQRAVELEPGLHQALHNISNLQAALGERERALAACRLALEQSPMDPDYLSNLATLCDDEELPDVEQRLRQAYARNQSSPHARATLEYALGRVCHQRHKWNEAFEHYRRANATRYAGFDIRGMLDRFAKLNRYFTPERIESLRDASESGARPVFIVGMPRSGTSLLEQILGEHSRISACGELRALNELLIPLLEAQDYAPVLDKETLQQLALDYLNRLPPAARDAPRFTDKMPLNFMHLAMITLMFPKARILHCRRDPLDTCLSCFTQDFASPNPFCRTIEDLGHYYIAYRELMSAWEDRFGSQILQIDYERLVSRTDEVSREAIEFCGLDWEPACLEFHRSKRAVHTASKLQVRKPVYSSSVGRYQRYETQLRPLTKILEAAGIHVRSGSRE